MRSLLHRSTPPNGLHAAPQPPTPEQAEVSDWDEEQHRRNLEALEGAGEIGQFFSTIYSAALAHNASLSSVRILPDAMADEMGRQASSKGGGSARYWTGNPDGRYSVTVQATEGFAFFERQMAERPETIIRSANALGVSPDAIDVRTYAGFIFAHELGHVDDFMKNAPTPDVQRPRRTNDMLSLPVPNIWPSRLPDFVNSAEGYQYIRDNLAYYTSQGINSVPDLLTAQERAYANMPTEAIPDQFAATVLLSMRTMPPEK